ncbi:MAG: hypothetical protein IK018_06665 [Lachnospiraceae bacterium]|nr:hypothetical protein [Lachnospiraceae bacterium]
MKKVLSLVLVVLTLVFIVSTPLTSNASQHGSHSVSFSYWFGSVTTTIDWDYEYGVKIKESTGYSAATGLCILAYTYRYKNWEDITHYFKTIVYRSLTAGISIGDVVGGTVGGDLVWISDTYYSFVTNKGNAASSHDETFE